ncbi:hypothetical protein V6N11_027845 [Hibiscus sabdariffa]|uniref:Uncharacterized protein n=1 Tax=Hibiscus sabdariffa TaxID=183260 RepID=A0ABR2NZG8_9ROSI
MCLFQGSKPVLPTKRASRFLETRRRWWLREHDWIEVHFLVLHGMDDTVTDPKVSQKTMPQLIKQSNYSKASYKISSSNPNEKP